MVAMILQSAPYSRVEMTSDS